MIPVILTVWVLIVGNSGSHNVPVIGPQQYSSMAACMKVKTKLDMITTESRVSSCIETQVVVGYTSKK